MRDKKRLRPRAITANSNPQSPIPQSAIPHPQSSSPIPHPSSLIPHPSSLIPNPSSLIPSPSPMFTVSRQIEFCYGHRLLGYAGKCRHLHGHNGRLVVVFEAAELDAHGMVVDFHEIKRQVGQWIDENLDHRMILARNDPAVAVLEKLGEPVYLMDESPTAENIAKLIFGIAAERGVPVAEVQLWETVNCCATYSPREPSMSADATPN